MQTYVGVDYHKSYSYINVSDEKGNVLREGKINNDKEQLKRFLAKYAENSKAVMEATRNWTVMYDWLEEEVEEVILAHPLKVKAIAEAKIKTDKIDASTLGHLLRADMIPEAYVPDKDTRDTKNLLRQRLFFVRLKTMAKNRIHVLIDRHWELQKDRKVIGEDLFSKSGIEWLGKVELGRDREILDRELALLEELERLVKDTDKKLTSLWKEDEEAKLVETIPGVGKFFAMLIVKEIGDISRFSRPQKLCAYAGLVPSTYSSGGRTYHGRIIKQGNKWLRWAMVEAVWPAIRADQSLKELYWHYKKNSGSANKAKVAVAKRLLTIVYRKLKEKREYVERVSSFQSL